VAGRGVGRLLTGLAGGIAMLRNWAPLVATPTQQELR
jgi:hypothetical protein